MFKRVLESRIWPILLLCAGAVGVGLMFVGSYLPPRVFKGALDACVVILILSLPASAHKRKRNLIEQRYFGALPEKRRQCALCGYDLTGNVSGICPECGAPIHRPEPNVPDIREELRKHRSGDVPGIVIFSVLTLFGIGLVVFAHGEARGVGAIVAFMCAVGAFGCVLELLWMRSYRGRR